MDNYLFNTDEITSSQRILHSPSEFARKNLMYVQEAGRLKSLKPHVSSRKNLESFLFFAIIKGSGSITVKDKKYNVKKGNCVLIDCMEAYEHLSSEENPWELAWVHFNGGNVKVLYEMIIADNDGNPFFKCSDVKKYETIVDSLMSGSQDKDVLYEMNASACIGQLLTYALADIKADKKNKNGNDLHRLREIVGERFREENLFEKLCVEYGFDESQINQEWKELYGIDLCDYILDRRFAYAKELLRFSVKPVKDIIAESGIGNADLFRHLFLEKERMTAEDYRKRWAQWNRG